MSKLIYSYHPRISNAWQEYLNELLSEVAQKGTYSGEIVTILRDFFAVPGKLIRPILFVYAYEQLGQKIANKQIIRLSLSLEILHAYLLIHDDVMDQSLLRRNGPSLHVRFRDLHSQKQLQGDANRFAENMALLLGDILSNEAEKLWSWALSKSLVTATTKQSFDELKDIVYWGQYLDIRLTAEPRIPSRAEILNIMRTKTGDYSIYRPFQLGILTANAAEPGWLKDFAEHLGILYQITDDILGTYGNQATTGKSVDSDILERKPTMLVHFAHAHALPADKQILVRYYAGGDQNSPQEVLAILDRTRAETHAKELAHNYYRRCTNDLETSDILPHIRHDLTELANTILKRTN